MVDFRNLVHKKRTVEYSDLLKLFESLDRKTSHIDLRPVQEEVILALNSMQQQKDIVLKISTGTGKTVIALLYLLSHMEGKNRPAVYFCPTIQLVNQVKEEADKLGIDAVVYPAGIPQPPVDGTRAKAIIICTYDKLFNAKTTFDRPDVMLRPCAIVLDDVHAGIEEIKEAFTLRVDHGDLFSQIIKIFDTTLYSYKPGLWKSIKDGDPIFSIEVPFWIWKPNLDNVREAMASHQTDANFVFVWEYLRDMLRWCRCIISGKGLEILPDILPIHMVKAYEEANHRMFMSATLADDSILVRELNCDSESAKKPLIPQKDKGMGERMVLTPALIDKKLDREFIIKLCTKIAKKFNVVVLSQSKKRGRDWESAGATLVIAEKVPEAIQKLKNVKEKYNCVVFVQRYDGIDLPDSSCRVLVIDGIPYGEGIADTFDSSVTETPGGIRNRLVYKIEQGMGRAIRSHADYAVIILVGPEIANFVARREVLERMNPDTRKQLELAINLTKLAIEEDTGTIEEIFFDLIKKSLRRDDAWKQYYRENVRCAKSEKPILNNNYGIEIAEAERVAFNHAIRNNFDEAVKIMGKTISEYIKKEKDKAWYLQRLANYKFEYNPGEAFEIQKAAYNKNITMFLPPKTTSKVKYGIKESTYCILKRWFEQFENPNGAVAAIEVIKSKLSYESPPKIFEKYIKELAGLIGAIGLQPGLGGEEGPDDLWLWEKISLVIEAKNKIQKSLHKKNAGQLLLSLEWFKNNYGSRDPAIPIIISTTNVCDKGAGFPTHVRVLLPHLMKNLLKNVESFYCALCIDPSKISNPGEVIKLLDSHKLNSNQFIKYYTEAIKYTT